MWLRYDLGMWDEASQEISATELMEFYANLIKDFPVVTIEDGFDEDDWPNWGEMVSKFGTDVQSTPERLTPYPAPHTRTCLLYTSPSPRDATLSRMPSSA